MPQREDDIIPHQDETEQVIAQKSRIRKIFGEVDVVDPLNGWTVGAGGGWSYLAGGELCLGITFRHTAAVALSKGNYGVIGGNIKEALRSLTYAAGRGQIHSSTDNTHVGGCLVATDDSGDLYIVADSDVSSTANLEIIIPQLRLPLADPDAARAFVAAL